ncbi:MAG: CRISPR-associated helicase Cas3' [Candidatus Aminicenantes bacterium]|nr:CRISPR-associated helicase Cas3' [Candidatus Aminicenantes bacterium]
MKFKQILGNDPYPHQEETFETLRKGTSVILRAPTGSGKSESVFVPFYELRGKSLPKRMLYSLPMRSLANSLGNRFKKKCPDLDVKVQHGKRPESILFEADCVVATLDQIVSSYTCAPLSLSVRYGNIPAGAVASSFLVFDEIHTFAPHLGLQCCLLIAERMSKLGIPFAIMSATLPTKFMFSIAERLKAQVIEAKEENIPVRMFRKVILDLKLSEELTADWVAKLYEESSGSVIVVCNTVERAIKIYQDLKEKIESKPILIHSRFFDVDREQKEKKIEELFGQKNNRKAILVTTQVIEVGMDISCELMLSELSPIDSLIQRAGRCARRGGEGRLIVFSIPHHAPYDKLIIDSTRQAIIKRNSERLTWEIEKAMVDEVLGEFFEKYSRTETGTKAMSFLSKAAFEGKPCLAAKAVREDMFVEVSISNDPAQLGSKILMLPRCRVHPFVIKEFYNTKKPKIWKVEIDRGYEDDYSPKIELIPVKSSNDIIINNFYVVDNEFAAYDSDLGLIFGFKGVPQELQESKEKNQELRFGEIPYETWTDHSRRVIEAFEKYIYPQEKYAFLKLSSWLEEKFQKVMNLIRLIMAIHDLGKLNEDWQRAAGATSVFLAHSGKRDAINLPIHATITAYVIGDYLKNEWGPILGDSAYFALAHHHSVRAAKVPCYKLQDGWYEEVDKVLDKFVGIKLPYNAIKSFERQLSATSLINPIPAFEKEKRYTTYILFSRWLRLADRKALEMAKSEVEKNGHKRWSKLC